MNPAQALHDQGQSLWLDKITRDMLDDGTLQSYRDDLSVSGLTSNPTIFEEAIGKGSAYDQQIESLARQGLDTEAVIAQLAISDLQRAADLFRPIFEQTGGLDGWVSMEVSPLLVHDTKATVQAAAAIHKAAAKPNLFVKIPGSQEGLSAIEEAVFSGIPVNVTLLFSTGQYVAAAQAYMRALERRLAAGRTVDVASVASMFVSRWDKAIVRDTPEPLHNRLGIALAQRTYKAYWEVLNSPRWHALESAGARPQRLLWASTGTKDPSVPEDLYVEALAAPGTLNTMPEKTLLAFAHGTSPPNGMRLLQEDPAPLLEQFKAAGVDTDALAEQLQDEGGAAFVKSWRALMAGIDRKRQALAA